MGDDKNSIKRKTVMGRGGPRTRLWDDVNTIEKDSDWPRGDKDYTVHIGDDNTTKEKDSDGTRGRGKD